MLNFGFGEMMLLAMIALIALGPKQLPEVARTLGRFIAEMRNVAKDFTNSIVDARESTDQILRNKRDQYQKQHQPSEQPTTGHFESPTLEPETQLSFSGLDQKNNGKSIDG